MIWLYYCEEQWQIKSVIRMDFRKVIKKMLRFLFQIKWTMNMYPLSMITWQVP